MRSFEAGWEDIPGSLEFLAKCSPPRLKRANLTQVIGPTRTCCPRSARRFGRRAIRVSHTQGLSCGMIWTDELHCTVLATTTEPSIRKGACTAARSVLKRG